MLIERTSSDYWYLEDELKGKIKKSPMLTIKSDRKKEISKVTRTSSKIFSIDIQNDYSILKSNLKKFIQLSEYEGIIKIIINYITSIEKFDIQYYNTFFSFESNLFVNLRKLIEQENQELKKLEADKLKEIFYQNEKKKSEKWIFENAEVHGDLSKAKVIFFGDCHIDSLAQEQQMIRTHIFNYYQKYYPKRNRRIDILFEGLASNKTLDAFSISSFCKRFLNPPTKLVQNKVVHFFGWEDMKLYQRHARVIVNADIINKKFNNLPPRKQFGSTEAKDLLSKLNELNLQKKELLVARNNAMILAVKKSSEVASLVFCIAGSLHYLSSHNDYDVREHIKVDSVIIIPKLSREISQEEINEYMGNIYRIV